MRERVAFLKPIAHRGLHTPANGLIENSAAAFEAAIAKGYGIEADVRPSACSTPMIFHDDTLERLIEDRDAVRAHDAATLKNFKSRGNPSPMIDFAELLELVDGREPVLAEIKSDWEPPDVAFLQSIAKLAAGYRGPLALMSYDPTVIAVLKEHPEIRLIILDPLSAFLGVKDSHRDADVREVLGPLSKLAADFGVTVIGIVHLNKTQSSDPMTRFLGSTGIIASARSAYLVHGDSDE